MQTIVIGHRNPDMDSICAAIGYAEFKRLSGHSDVVAARCGNTNERIDFVLQKFGFQAPLLVTDLTPRVLDVMQPKVVCVNADSPVYDAVQLIDQKNLRGLPVVDEDGRCLGLLSSFKITHLLFPSRDDANSARMVTASLSDIVTTFGGRLITGSVDHTPREHLLMVCAMAQDSFVPRLRRYTDKRVILFVGDRPHIHDLAIKENVQAIVVTGGLQVADSIIKDALEAGVTIISSPHDTASTVLLARGAVRVRRMIQTEYTSFLCDTPLEEARQTAAESGQFVFPVLNEEGRLVGILSKSDFIKTIPRQLILVDHNELTQAVRGAADVPIIEILDHHKLGGFSSHTPILFWNNPVGSTSSIVALCFQNAGIPIPKAIAGLLMAGLIADTLNLTSPTTTATDRRLLEHLSHIAEVVPSVLAAEIFAVGSPLLTMSPAQAIGADSKVYSENGHSFSVAQIEELSFAHFPEKRDALLEELERQRTKANLLFSSLLVTDINEQTSLLLVRGTPAFLQTIDYPEKSHFIWELSGVVSRKKQLLPYLLQCVIKMRAS
ncbi:MAG: putative manganese-dependent inorganic diphosphatase [Verrucomicrobia bacterium]|nr:putative manganese-dependent inorganic diphosphatase [Verrucomicrobiota bacterium]